MQWTYNCIVGGKKMAYGHLTKAKKKKDINIKKEIEDYLRYELL